MTSDMKYGAKTLGERKPPGGNWDPSLVIVAELYPWRVPQTTNSTWYIQHDWSLGM